MHGLPGADFHRKVIKNITFRHETEVRKPPGLPTATPPRSLAFSYAQAHKGRQAVRGSGALPVIHYYARTRQG